ncbi:MFS transporter [Psychromicrobium sp. YIM B11713]|uniref:MFS transporter n=1 Tax=Psychromicrobium sp. YIM B11713 TaxID=3145233 RepID=UPI00374F51EC
MNLPLIGRNRNFTLVWLGQVLSQAGTRVYQIALLWWLLSQLPDDIRGLAGGAFLVVGALPGLLLMKVIGRILDSVPSRTVLLRAEVTAGVAVAVLIPFAAHDAVPVWAVYVVGLIVATCQSFVDPCLTKATPELVAEADIERAIGFETATQPVANVAGAALGAALMGTLGFTGVIILNAASYAVAAGFLVAARFRSVAAERPAPGEAPAARQSTREFLRSLPGVGPLLACFAAANFFSAPTLLILPLYTSAVLHEGPATLAALEAALWLGLLLGAFLAARIRVPGRTTQFGAVCIAGFALFLGIPGVVPSALVYAVVLLLAGLCLGVSNVKFVALFQRVVSDGSKGRFFAILTAAMSATFPVAFVLFGVLGDTVSPQWLCVAQAVGLALVAVALAPRRDPQTAVTKADAAPAVG